VVVGLMSVVVTSATILTILVLILRCSWDEEQPEVVEMGQLALMEVASQVVAAALQPS